MFLRESDGKIISFMSELLNPSFKLINSNHWSIQERNTLTGFMSESINHLLNQFVKHWFKHHHYVLLGDNGSAPALF